MHRKKLAALALTLVTAMTVTSLPTYTAFAAEAPQQVTEIVQNEEKQTIQEEDVQEENEIQQLDIDEDSMAANNVKTIDNDTENPVETIQNAINEAKEDITIRLMADPEYGSSEVVYEFSSGLSVPAGIKVSIIGREGVTYRFVAKDENAISVHKNGEKYSGFILLNSNSGLSLKNVIIDANQQGRALMNYCGTVTLSTGAAIENGYLTDSSLALTGAGIWSYSGGNSYKAVITLEEGSFVRNNKISSKEKDASGAGIYLDGSQGSLSIAGGTISDNSIEIDDNSRSVSGYGAGVHIGIMNSFEMTAGMITNNQIDGSMSEADGAGVYLAGSSGVLWKVSITGGVITGNRINATITSANGAGVWVRSKVIVGENAVVASNYVGESENDLYTYIGYIEVASSLNEGASIGVKSGEVAPGETYALIKGSSSYSLTESDAAVFTYNNDSGSEEFYELTLDPDSNSILAGKEAVVEGSEVRVEDEAGLKAALSGASNVKASPTQIILTKDIHVSSTLELAARRYVEISSAEGENYSIIADEMLAPTTMGNLFSVAGNLKLTNVILDANQKGRVLYTLSGANVTISEGAVIKNGYAISDFASDVNGVGVLIGNGSTVTLEEGGRITQNTTRDPSVVDDNGNAIGSAARAMGSGIYNSGTFIMTGGEITENGALSTNGEIGGSVNGSSSGGALYNIGTVRITGGTISGNRVWGSGGAIYNIGSGAAIDISGDAIISGNKAYMETENKVAYTGGSGVCGFRKG